MENWRFTTAPWHEQVLFLVVAIPLCIGMAWLHEWFMERYRKFK